MGEDLESVVGELRCFASESKDAFDKKRLNQIADIIEKETTPKAKCSTNMSEPINLDSIMGEINQIGNQLELYGLDYNTMNTRIYRIGLRLQELYDKYKDYKKGIGE